MENLRSAVAGHVIAGTVRPAVSSGKPDHGNTTGARCTGAMPSQAQTQGSKKEKLHTVFITVVRSYPSYRLRLQPVEKGFQPPHTKSKTD